MTAMTSGKDRPLWWFVALRNGAIVFASEALGITVYRMASHGEGRPMPWGGLVFATVVAVITGALVSKRGRDRR